MIIDARMRAAKVTFAELCSGTSDHGLSNMAVMQEGCVPFPRQKAGLMIKLITSK